MRRIFVLLLFVAFISDAQSQRALLVSEAIRLQTAIVAKDSVEVSDFFDFPIEDENAQWFIAHEASESKTDKACFLSNYSEIIGEDVFRMFAVFDLSQLNSVDSLSITLPNSDLCTATYEVKADGNKIHFNFYVNGRDEFSEEHADDLTDDFVCPEYAQFWTFELVNQRLKFKKFTMAG